MNTLAERTAILLGAEVQVHNGVRFLIMPNGRTDVPDPEADANADVAVLKWVRKNWPAEKYVAFKKALARLQFERLFSFIPSDFTLTQLLLLGYIDEYQVGDYARAADAVEGER